MVYLKQGEDKYLWFSLRESEPIGSTNSFTMTFTNDVSNESKSYKPVDIQPDNKWSRFLIQPVENKASENLLIGKPYLVPGMWSFTIIDNKDSTILETGKVLVVEKVITPITTLERPAKSKVVLRR